jgi:hypothetical protein
MTINQSTKPTGNAEITNNYLFIYLFEFNQEKWINYLNLHLIMP